jgi:23S rRNA pseudouridine1911/1915/1917 synthase
LELPIIRETAHWLAIDKPAGLITERNPWEASAEALVFDYLQRGRRPPFLGIVHRLDRVTSGVLLLAKKKSALRELNRQFAERQVQKTYLAMVEQLPAHAEGELTHWLVKSQAEKRALVYAQEQPGSLRCSLHYRCLSGNLLEVRPATGTFHQIRAQLAAIGCPIAGDQLYGASQVYRPRAIMLHAWRLQFTDPSSGQAVALEAPPPWGSADQAG